MKKIYGFVAVLFLTLAGCSGDDKSTSYTETNEIAETRLKADCVFENGPLETYNSMLTNGVGVRLSWTNGLDVNPTLTYSARIEIRTTTRRCSIPLSSQTDIPINLFASNTSYTKSTGFGGCFKWRIYYQGVNDLSGQVQCSGATAWNEFPW